MARIERIEIAQVDIPPKVLRTDAIQSFVTQETVFVTLRCDDGSEGTGYTYTIGTGGSSVVALPREWQLAGGAQARVPLYTTEGGWLQLETDELVRQAQHARADGFPGAKIKVGKPHVAHDMERLSAVREAVGADFEIMVNANQYASLCAAVPNACWVEYISQLDDLTTSRLHIADGHAHAPDAPGLGIAWDTDRLRAGHRFVPLDVRA